MKVLDYWELKSYLPWLNEQLEGAQLQSITTNDQQILLEFYKSGSTWVLIHLAQSFPVVLVLSQPLKMKKATKPVGLFLNSHAKNLRWQSAELLEELGRVVQISLGNSKKKIIMQLCLVPKAANLQVEMIGEEKKKISWDKPKELGQAHVPPEHSIDFQWSHWIEQAQAQICGIVSKEENQSSKAIATQIAAQTKTLVKAIEKKQKALLSMQENLQKNEAAHWRDLGEAIKSGVALSSEQQQLYDAKISINENMQKAFQKAKDLERKKHGTLERIEVLRKEIESLQHSLLQPQALGEKRPQALNRGLLEKAQSQGRRLNLAPGFEAVIGKSAKDNLDLLRKANSWDLWFHLKDYPGAHAIIHLPKGKSVAASMLEQVATWVVRESLKKSEVLGAYDVVVVETRYVRPIKGDKLGRVTYHNPKVYRVNLKTASSS